MIEKVKRTIKDHKLIEEGDKVLAAVSGGPDSVCLLDILFKLKEELNFQLAAAHYNHCLRDTAERDQKFVEDLCSAYGVELFYGRGKPKDAGFGLEDAARRARYRFLEETAKNKGFNKIALGHTLSDNVENLFIRIIRGAGLEGLKGMLPKRDLYIRPLLEVTRKEVLKYLAQNNLNYMEDETNRDITILRNWIRHRLIPVLKERNPSIEETAGGILKSLREDWKLIEGLVDEVERRLDFSFREGVLYINLQNTNLEDVLWRHLFFRLLYRYFYPGLSGALSIAHVEGLVKMAKRSEGSERLNLPGGIEAVREYHHLYIGPKRKEPEDKELLIPSTGVYLFGDYIFTVKKGSFTSLISGGRWCALFDAEKVGFPLVLRYRKPGDRLLIPGVGRKKLQDFFVDAKVPRSERKRTPLLVNSKGEILWIVGYRQREDLRPSNGEAILIEARRKR